MDELDGLLAELASEPMASAAVERVWPRLQQRVQRQRVRRAQWAVAASLAIVLCGLAPWMVESRFPAPELPAAGEARIAPADLTIPVLHEAPPRELSHQRPRVLPNGLIQLPSTDPKVVLLWSLDKEVEGESE